MTRRLLLVTPRFHGYATSLGDTFSQMGYETRVHPYDAPLRPNDRLQMRAALRNANTARTRRLRRRITAAAIHALREYRPAVVVTIRGDLLDSEWWHVIRGTGTAQITWFYDELRRMRFTPTMLAAMGPIATYSPIDTALLQSEGIDAHNVPLGYDALLPIQPRLVTGISFIGARYANRERLLRMLDRNGTKVKAFGRDWSRRPIDIIRSGRFTHPGIPTGPALPRASAYGAMRDAPATLNLHGDQDGMTMRTFEAPGTGAVEICDRADVSDFYDVGSEVLTFDSDEELVDLCHRVTTDHGWAARIRERGRARTLDEHTLTHRLRALELLWA